jgi:hypothetical protein
MNKTFSTPSRCNLKKLICGFLLCLGLFSFQKTSAEYALLSKRASSVPITKFTVIAERASGSNYLEALMMFNTSVPSTPFFHKHFPPWFALPATKYFGKSAFYTFENTDDCLFIVVFRDPYDWVRSLHRQPHLSSPELRALPFDQFIHKTWQLDTKDPEFLREFSYNPLVDRNPENGAPFENVMRLRSAKIRNMLMIKERAKNVYYINYETARDFPQEVLAEISKIYAISLNPAYYPIVHYKGHTALPLYKKSKYTAFAPEQILYINSQLDKALERQIGYDLKE